jgi:hypothetical protein
MLLIHPGTSPISPEAHASSECTDLDCPLVSVDALTPVDQLFDTSQDGTAARDLETYARANSGSVPWDYSLDPQLKAAVSTLFGYLQLSPQNFVASGFRPFQYQQHFFDLAAEYKAILRTAPRGTVAKATSGDVPQIRVHDSAGLGLELENRIGIVNRELRLHGIQRNKSSGNPAVNSPADSEHTQGLAVDFSKRLPSAAGLSLAELDSLACLSGLCRVHAQTERAYHYELQSLQSLPCKCRPLVGGTYRGVYFYSFPVPDTPCIVTVKSVVVFTLAMDGQSILGNGIDSAYSGQLNTVTCEVTHQRKVPQSVALSGTLNGLAFSGVLSEFGIEIPVTGQVSTDGDTFDLSFVTLSRR